MRTEAPSGVGRIIRNSKCKAVLKLGLTFDELKYFRCAKRGLRVAPLPEPELQVQLVKVRVQTANRNVPASHRWFKREPEVSASCSESVAAVLCRHRIGWTCRRSNVPAKPGSHLGRRFPSEAGELTSSARTRRETRLRLWSVDHLAAVTRQRMADR